MKINKLYTGIVLASVLIMTGCGSDDSDSVVNTGGNSNNGSNNFNTKLSYAVFDPFGDVSNGNYKRAWGKLAYQFSNTSFIETISTVVGSSPTAYQDSISDNRRIEYYAGDNVFAAVPTVVENKYYKINFIDSDTFKFKIQTDNAPINSTFNVATLDLEGVGQQPANAKTGIATDLSYFPDNFRATFPKGSKCYIFLETPDQNFYTFSDDDDYDGSLTIKEWLAKRKQFETVNNIVEENVGLNNELQAARYTNGSGDIVAAVRYSGVIYDAFYNQQGVEEEYNLDPNVDEVYCSQYNDVAAKFFEEQIKANYKW